MMERFEVSDYVYSVSQNGIDHKLELRFEAINPRWPSPRHAGEHLVLLAENLTDTLSQLLSHIDITINVALESHTSYGKLRLSVVRHGFISPNIQIELLHIFKEAIHDAVVNQDAPRRWQDREMGCETGTAYSATIEGATVQAKFHLELPTGASIEELREFLVSAQWAGSKLIAKAAKPSGQFLLTGDVVDMAGEGGWYYDTFINRAMAAHFSQSG